MIWFFVVKLGLYMAGVSGPRYQQLPLWRDSQRLLLEVEQAVRGFTRYHKYSLGAELRQPVLWTWRVAKWPLALCFGLTDRY